MRFGRPLREELFVPGPLLLIFDAQEHSDSAGCTVEALSLFIPLVSTCTSSLKVLCSIGTSLEPSGYLVALSALKKNKKKNRKLQVYYYQVDRVAKGKS